MSQYNILVVDDDREIVRSLGKVLELEGYTVKKAYNGMEALDILVTDQIHLILLDVMMPKMNGLSALMKIREKNNIPIIMLSAKTEESDKVIGLSMGADDYVAKPFRPRELLARVAAAIRRSQPKVARLTLGDVVIDPDRAHVEKGGREVVLSALEYRLLLLFAKNKGRVVTRDMMREALWDDAGAYIEENTLSVYIKRLRDKLEDDPCAPALITTVRGMGYRAVG